MKQLLVVLAKGLDATQGTLFACTPGMDKPHFSFPVVLGKNGLGWGRGEHAYWIVSGRQKMEGDGRSPAGLFRLGSAFGRTKPNKCRLPFLQIEAAHRCIDDPSSRFYNIIVSEECVVKDWKSSESMLRDDELYDAGIVIDHNANPVTPGLGSCIFLHLWRSRDSGTEGCTAMERKNMVQLLEWLDPKCDPLLLQIPEGAYPSFLSALNNETIRSSVTSVLSALIKPNG